MKLIYFLSNLAIIILVFLLFLCFTSNIIAQEYKETTTSDCTEDMRLTELFIIGEKTVGIKSQDVGGANKYSDRTRKSHKDKNIYQGIRKLRNFDKINAFSILDVKLKKEKSIIPCLRHKKNFNILLVAELRKNGERTWNRISTINKYTRKIKKSSLWEEPLDPNTTIKSFFVVDEILSDNPFIKQDDLVQVFYFFDIEKSRVFLKDLEDAQQNSRSLMTIDAQEMYLFTIGSAPQKYTAKDGDEIRLRFLRAEYSIKRLVKVKESMKNGVKLKNCEKYADIVSVEDEMNFVFKEFGIKLNISPTIVFGSRVTNKFDAREFNPISKNPSLGSNIYLIYEGRKLNKKILNYIPGIHLSLLRLNNSDEAKFTLGIVSPIIPRFRKYFGIFYGWHNLKEPVIGLTFSPSIDFMALVSAEEGR